MQSNKSFCVPSSHAGLYRFTSVLILLALVFQVSPVLAARAMKAADVRSGYREVLATLATGDEEKALSELFDLETAVLGKKITQGRVEGYWKLKLGVIRDLLASETLEILIPITVLHHDAYLMYREKGSRMLAAHSRVMASELADFYANKADTEGANRFAGWVLTSFGAYLQDFWALTSSAEYFMRALERDPSNEVARFRLAASLEKRGDYREAIEQLEHAVKLDRGNDHARLRLALCQARAGVPFQNLDAARQSFATVMKGSGPDWVRSVAIQELARLEQEAADDTEAERLLRGGLEWYPNDQQLSLALANLLDRERRPAEARDVIDSIRGQGWEGTSARYRYNTWPAAGIEEARESLRGMMPPGLTPLEAVLSGESSEAVGK